MKVKIKVQKTIIRDENGNRLTKSGAVEGNKDNLMKSRVHQRKRRRRKMVALLSHSPSIVSYLMTLAKRCLPSSHMTFNHSQSQQLDNFLCFRAFSRDKLDHIHTTSILGEHYVWSHGCSNNLWMYQEVG